MVVEEVDVVEHDVRLPQLVQVDQTAHSDPRHEPVLAVVVRHELKGQPSTGQSCSVGTDGTASDSLDHSGKKKITTNPGFPLAYPLSLYQSTTTDLQ